MNARPPELPSLLNTEHVHFLSGPRSKRELLDAMVRRLAELDGLPDAAGILRDILRREAESSTGVGRGVAIPHSAPDTDREHLLLGRVDPPVPFDSHDGLPVVLVFLLVTPWKKQMLYLRLLSEIARLTRRPGVIARMRDAGDAGTLLDILEDALRPQL